MDQIESTGLVAIIRAPGSEQLIDAVNALRDGGVTCIEVTMTTPNALDVIRAARGAVGDAAVIGVGSVLDAATARAAMLAGAQFVVAPTTDLPTIEICRRYSVPVMPGALSPTEILRAFQAGADMVKVFPTSTLGPQYLKDLRGPLPQVKLVPTGGVNLDTAGDFIRAGAAALGVGSALVNKQVLRDGDFAKLKATASAFLDRVRQARTAG
ncbi:MAG: bifunctional 4-hydroxy-2-oxoglutarate aldolase/2-dehydro-3-deoxy-phosphogluconate aldolase [Phycisphaerae bacterium]|nr:bifunctional 4-hydroxy-2-oxoglutarate aldolase/2-dehydro-3-deoxy-phosphogluconate aldolase [Phycisphaerae bacterium]